MLLSLLEIIAIALFISLWMSQIVLPIGRGTPLFPYFRRETKLHKALQEAEQHRLERELEEELACKEAFTSEGAPIGDEEKE